MTDGRRTIVGGVSLVGAWMLRGALFGRLANDCLANDWTGGATFFAIRAVATADLC